MKTIPRGIHSSRQHEPLDHSPPVAQRTGAPSPERPTLLEDEIANIITEHESGLIDNLHAARRILKIDRIRRGLQLLEISDLNAARIHRPRLDSSDAR